MTYVCMIMDCTSWGMPNYVKQEDQTPEQVTSFLYIRWDLYKNKRDSYGWKCCKECTPRKVSLPSRCISEGGRADEGLLRSEKVVQHASSSVRTKLMRNQQENRILKATPQLSLIIPFCFYSVIFSVLSFLFHNYSLFSFTFLLLHAFPLGLCLLPPNILLVLPSFQMRQTSYFMVVSLY